MPLPKYAFTQIGVGGIVVNAAGEVGVSTWLVYFVVMWCFLLGSTILGVTFASPPEQISPEIVPFSVSALAVVANKAEPPRSSWCRSASVPCRNSRTKVAIPYSHRWNRTFRPQPQTLNKCVFLIEVA